jgi:hypothetical protein
MKADECGRINNVFKSRAEILQQRRTYFTQFKCILIMYVRMYNGTHKCIPELSLYY